MTRDPRIAWWGAATAALTLIGGILVRSSVAVPATTWMHIYDPAEFRTTRALVDFLAGLRVPIPPVIAALEILNVQHTGSADLVTVYLYRFAVVASYVSALWFSYPSIARLVGSFCASTVFLWATTLIHPLNPQSYDVLFPLFVLAFLLLLRAATRAAAGSALLFAAGAGFFLSMAELTRPFVFVLLPLMLAGACIALRDRRRALIGLFAPVVLLSGVWHLHLLAAHHQILATNYAGFNLHRAWPMAPLPPTMWETHSHPDDEKRWPDLNTEAEHVASLQLQRVVAAYVLANPGAALRYAARKLVRFARPQLSMYGRAPAAHPVLSVYRVAAPASFLFTAANLALLAGYALSARRRIWLLLASTDNLLLLITGFTVLVLSLGEAKEEARLALSVLPFLAAYPTARQVP
jgi:hypothetical protein